MKKRAKASPDRPTSDRTNRLRIRGFAAGLKRPRGFMGFFFGNFERTAQTAKPAVQGENETVGWKRRGTEPRLQSLASPKKVRPRKRRLFRSGEPSTKVESRKGPFLRAMGPLWTPIGFHPSNKVRSHDRLYLIDSNKARGLFKIFLGSTASRRRNGSAGGCFESGDGRKINSAKRSFGGGRLFLS